MNVLSLSDRPVLRTAPGLVAVQARLFAPHVQGSGRWVLFDPTTRRSFAAVGKDVVPDVIRVLARAAGMGVFVHELDDLLGLDGAEQRERLCHAGLLVEARPPSSRVASGATSPPTFVSRYHEANFDYPFLDYSGTDWREKDRRIMAAYNWVQPPPANVVERPGPMISLPEVGDADLFAEGELEERGLATVLRYTFGPLEVLSGAFKDHLRKTSPSGGARHPTEGVVVLLRALRPTVLDAGHIAETLAILLARRQMATAVVPLPASDAADWVSEPEFALVVAAPGSRGVPGAAAASTIGGPGAFSDRRTVPPGRAEAMLTNPFAYVSFTESSGMAVEIPWPTPSRVDLGLGGFRILSHCQPSSRGDRDTTATGVLAAIPEAGPAELASLRTSGALLAAAQARSLYRQASPWCQHDWYLSLLAHAEVRGHAPKCLEALRLRVAAHRGETTAWAMLQRRTTRAFADRPIAWDTLCDLISVLALPARPTVRVLVSALAVDQRRPATFEVQSGSSEAVVVCDGPDRGAVQEICVGQLPAARGAAVIWLLGRVDPVDVARYETDLIELGRIGQRICLRATELGLGVFQSPAVVDRALQRTLPVGNARLFVTYAFTVGHPERG
ncbi:MAG: hypothetical protein JO115_11415 [Pseudonocardiales bacterium]|nr:hypothetical protein [Pseudonocardiales bacterium]